MAIDGLSTAKMKLRDVLKLLSTDRRPIAIQFGKRNLEGVS